MNQTGSRPQIDYTLRIDAYATGCGVLRSDGALHTVSAGDWGVPATVKNATTNLLDEVREFKGLESDYALAKVLNVRTQTISSYRTGRTQMNAEMALRAARVLGRAPAPLFAMLAAERAKNPDVAKVWADAARDLARNFRK